jgi:hypothetical protein
MEIGFLKIRERETYCKLISAGFLVRRRETGKTAAV